MGTPEPTPAPSTEADPVPGEDIWVTAAHAADAVGRSEAWIDEQCQAGKLACRRTTQDGHDLLLVPMAATRELAGSS